MAEAEQEEYSSEGIDDIQRTSPDELFLITIVARPNLDSDEYGQAGGAYVCCWVDADDLRTAERRAVGLIQENRWRPVCFDNRDLVRRANYDDYDATNAGPDLREIVEQTFVDGEVCVYHTWPVDAPDADEDL